MDYQDQREEAVRRIEQKREFRFHLVGYVVINAFLVALWAVLGGGYFWPGWVLAGWGIGLVLHGWQTFHNEKPISEEDIQRELGGAA